MPIKPTVAFVTLASLVPALLPSLAFATFSSVACGKGGNCGVAVATERQVGMVDAKGRSANYTGLARHRSARGWRGRTHP